jgi:hypothetical protein
MLGWHRSSRLGLTVGLAIAALIPAPAAGQSPLDSLPRTRLMLLGMFHFDDQGLDEYKPAFPWNALTSEHQREIEDVIERLARFNPTRIALEWPAGRQAALDSAYQAYRSGRAGLAANEREQIGFRLAHRLGHERVYAVDAPARSYEPDMTQAEYDRRAGALIEGADPALLRRQQDLESRYAALHRRDDSLKTTMPLRDYLVQENAPAALRVSHGEYLIGGFRLGRGDDYLGPDLRTRWYNRNLRIFHNLLRITPSPAERILLVIGSGHIPILRHAAEASPEFEVVDVGQFLGP